LPPSFDCVLINGTVVNHDGIGPRDIGVRDGRIAEIGALSGAVAGERVDCRCLHILPGVIDSQVHFREPGLVHKEDLETGSRAAVLGGVTAVFEMPNTDPPTTSADALADKLARGEGRMHCHLPYGSAARATMSPIFPISSGCPARRGSRCSWAPRPGAFWSPTMRACWRSSSRPAAARRSIARTRRA